MLRSKTIKDADPVVRETESDSDCLADRAVALDDQKVSIENISKDLRNQLSSLITISILNLRTVPKPYMYQNVLPMDVINEYNVIDLLAIVGVYMKTPAKIYQGHQSKMVDQTVQIIRVDP